MGADTKIEWCDHTFNPWTGCTKVSPGCANCYAEGWAKRSGLVKWGPGAPRRLTSVVNWREPAKWNDEAAKALRVWQKLHDAAVAEGKDKHGPGLRWLAQHYAAKPRRPRVFCASLADWLDDEVPVEWLADLLGLIQATPNLDWLLLTKRPQNFLGRLISVDCSERKKSPILAPTPISSFGDAWIKGFPPANVWVGTTVEDQTRADERIPALLKIPARVRFLSCEPLLGPVDLGLFKYRDAADRIGSGTVLTTGRRSLDWVICGGESGPKARPMHPNWPRSLRDQCAAAKVAFFFKQWGHHDYRGVYWPKSKWNRLLEGVEHNAFPEVRHD